MDIAADEKKKMLSTLWTRRAIRHLKVDKGLVWHRTATNYQRVVFERGTIIQARHGIR